MLVKLEQVVRGFTVLFYAIMRLSGQCPIRSDGKVSRFWLPYSVLFTGLLVVTFLTEACPVLHFKIQDEVVTGMNLHVTQLHYFSKIVVAVAICSSDVVHSRRAAKLWSSLQTVFQELLLLERDSRAYRMSLIVFMGRTLVQIAVHTATNVLKYLYISDQELHVGWFPVFVLMLPSVVISICANQHAAITLVLTHGLEKLNGALDGEVRRINRRPFRTQFQRVSMHSTASERIDELSNLHKELYGAIHEFGKLYSGRISLVVSYLFINIISELFFIANHIACRANGLVPPSQIIELFGFGNLCLFSTELYYILKASQSLKDATEETGLIIHKIYIVHLDERLKQSIEFLSLRLRLSDVGINPMGLFSLNMPALYKMIHGIITFLTILVQFKMAEDYESYHK